MKVRIRIPHGPLLKAERPSASTVLFSPFIRAAHSVVKMIGEEESAQTPAQLLTADEIQARVRTPKDPQTIPEMVHEHAMRQVFHADTPIKQKSAFTKMLQNMERLPQDQILAAAEFGAVRSQNHPDLEKKFIDRWVRAVDAQSLSGQYHAISHALSANGTRNFERSYNFGLAITEQQKKLNINNQTPAPDREKPGGGLFTALLNLSLS